MSDNNHDLWGSFKESVLKICNEVCGYKKNWNCNVDMCWWNSGVTDEIQQKKKHIKKLKNLTEEAKNEYRRLKKAAKKAVARAMKKINELGRNHINVYRLVRKMKIERTDVVDEGACEEMMEHFTLMRIMQNSGKHICKKI